MNLFKKLCKQNQLWKYNLIHDRLNVCTQRHVRDRKAARDAAVRAHVEAVAAQLADMLLCFLTSISEILDGAIENTLNDGCKWQCPVSSEDRYAPCCSLMQLFSAQEIVRC